MRLRVVVYNVRGLRDGLTRVAAVIRRHGPDLVMMNESGARWRRRRLARAVGMTSAGDPWSPFRRRVKDSVLVRQPWRIVEHRLVRFAGSARFSPRGALVARVEGPGAGVWAVAVHLGLRPAERLRHARELAAALEGLEGPLVLGGDLNDRPDGRAVTFLGERYGDAWLLAGDVGGETFPADEPTARIDYLLVSAQVRVERVMVPPTPDVRSASDHRPVVADVRLPDPRAPSG